MGDVAEAQEARDLAVRAEKASVRSGAAQSWSRHWSHPCVWQVDQNRAAVRMTSGWRSYKNGRTLWPTESLASRVGGGEPWIVRAAFPILLVQLHRLERREAATILHRMSAADETCEASARLMASEPVGRRRGDSAYRTPAASLIRTADIKYSQAGSCYFLRSELQYCWRQCRVSGPGSVIVVSEHVRSLAKGSPARCRRTRTLNAG